MNSPAQSQLDEWILQQRPGKNMVDPSRPYAFLTEKEHSRIGRIDDVTTIFLTNKECPFRCLMCDLWRNTLDVPVVPGDIPGQIQWALDQLPLAQHIKLYNSGNFFDPNAIPECDYEPIAHLVSPFTSVIVESHPLMIGRRCFAFHEFVFPRLEIAMGLEVAHPEILAKLNKRMTLDDFETATVELSDRGIPVRAFILLSPPYMPASEAVDWARRSIDFAFDCGVECCTVIPTREGNGVMETLAKQGPFTRPSLAMLEDVLDYGLSLHRGRVFVDLWDIEKLCPIATDSSARVERLNRMNLSQRCEPRWQASVPDEA